MFVKVVMIILSMNLFIILFSDQGDVFKWINLCKQLSKNYKDT